VHAAGALSHHSRLDRQKDDWIRCEDGDQWRMRTGTMTGGPLRRLQELAG
jgi:hypothetical protein